MIAGDARAESGEYLFRCAEVKLVRIAVILPFVLVSPLWAMERQGDGVRLPRR